MHENLSAKPDTQALQTIKKKYISKIKVHMLVFNTFYISFFLILTKLEWGRYIFVKIHIKFHSNPSPVGEDCSIWIYTHKTANQRTDIAKLQLLFAVSCKYI